MLAMIRNFPPQLAQRNEFAGARRHRDFLSATVKHGELHQRDGELPGIQSQRAQRAFHPRYVAMMVCTPYVDHQVESALELVEVIGDIGREIGVAAVGFLQRPIDVVTSKPERPGRNVRLTIDHEIQAAAEEVLVKTVRIWGAKGGTAIVMNPSTGAILAMANAPTTANLARRAIHACFPPPWSTPSFPRVSGPGDGRTGRSLL
jgi:hypothetical protein